MRRSMPLLPLMVALAACANVPAATPAADQEAKRFDPPPPDKGAIYLYREGWFGFARAIEVTLDGQQPSRLASNTFVRIERVAGTVDVTCRTGDSAASRQVAIAPGETRYVEVTMGAGLWGPNCAVQEVSPQQGQAGILAGKRVEAF